MIFVIGGRGRLGQALSAHYQDQEAVSLHREIYEDWWRDDAQDGVIEFFAPYAGSGGIIFVAAGLLDPTAPQEDHSKINYLLPKHVIDGATQLGMRVVTFGTIMERIINRKNPYIQSKAALGEYVANIGDAQNQVLHVRVHTLFGGGEPSSFMFLGQIYRALKNKTVFEMSPGNQLREYHHIEDEVRAVRVLADSKIRGVVDLNHGEPVSLKAVANHIFKSFDAESLLRIGALPEPKEENFGEIFQRLDLLKSVNFRETLPAIVTYLKALSSK